MEVQTTPPLLDGENLAAMVAEGYIAAKPGPDGLTLYNYTPRAQYGRVWNPETMACRGIILRADGSVQARPFSKFFNVQEHVESDLLPPLPVEPFDVFEKMDGSLIVATTFEGKPLLTTRGSFDSDQAIAARKLWDERYADVEIPDGETWCFEFIAPWNRIVVDYGDRTDLVLLARLDNATGADLPLPEWPGPVVKTFDGLADFDALLAKLDGLGPNDEGFVLRFASGVRAKAKGAEYVRLHRLLTGVSARTIWEYLAAGMPLDEILDAVPDEFYAWVNATAADLSAQYAEIERRVIAQHGEIVSLPTRKDQALAIADFDHRSCVFKHLDGKPFDDLIWKALRPAAERPFRNDADV